MCINITCIIRSTVSFVVSYSRPIILWLRLGGGGGGDILIYVIYMSLTSFIHPAIATLMFSLYNLFRYLVIYLLYLCFKCIL